IAPEMPPLDASAAEHARFYGALAKSPMYAFIRLLIMSQLAPMALFAGGLYPEDAVRRAREADLGHPHEASTDDADDAD
ncbi:MAG TPA: hypothetical protein VFX76_05170, partial [Roseiflexaceae bacterium]|nr:hypothetical protein [Roseiflexaceae bacterium]